MSAVHETSVPSSSTGSTSKLNHSLDLHLPIADIVENSLGEKKYLEFQHKPTLLYSPVSPVFQTFPSVPAFSLPSISSESGYRQEGKLSIENLVEVSLDLNENESVCQYSNERLHYPSRFAFPRLGEPKKIQESSYSVTSDSSSSCKMARAAPFRSNEFADMKRLTSSNGTKNGSYSCIFSKSEVQEIENVALFEKSSTKKVSLNPVKVCSNCSTTTSPNWYLAEDKRPLCNACGKFWKRTGKHRPSCRWGRRIKKRTSCNGSRNMKIQRNQDFREFLNKTSHCFSMLWDHSLTGRESPKSGWWSGVSWDNGLNEQNKRTTSYSNHSSKIREPFEAKKDGRYFSREYQSRLERNAALHLPLEPTESQTLSVVNRQNGNSYNQSNMAVESDMRSSTSFSTRETESNPLPHDYAKYFVEHSMSATSRKSQLFALEDTFAKISDSRASSSSESLIEMLALAASNALETLDP